MRVSEFARAARSVLVPLMSELFGLPTRNDANLRRGAIPSRGHARLLSGAWSGGYPLLGTSQCTDAFESNVGTFLGAASISFND